MKLHLIFIGKPKPPATAAAIVEYLSRLQRLNGCEVQYLRPEKVDKRPPDDIKVAEGERILQALRPDDAVVACDEHGKAISTGGIVKLLRAAAAGELAGKRRLVVIVGGALGLGRNVLGRADRTWSLSGLTMAESVARTVLAEGLYRAATIIHGHPYHNG
jgi:23S rRNA (pseudouridine1915-N3)-methyltransferase